VDVSHLCSYFSHACPFEARRSFMDLVKVRSVLTSATIEVSNSRPLLKSDILILNQGFPSVMEVNYIFVFVVGASD